MKMKTSNGVNKNGAKNNEKDGVNLKDKTNGVNGNGTKNNKNKIKKKKDAIKSVIDSPYSLTWPAFDHKFYTDIVSSLEHSFNEYVITLRKEAEKSSCTLDATSKLKDITKKLVVKAEPLCIVFGYNSVMRGLEKDKIKTVFVKAEALSAFLTKAFIPICESKKIPLFPIKNLHQIFEKHISNKSMLAVGLTGSACEENAPFYDLFKKCRKVLVFESSETTTEDKPISNLNPVGKKQPKPLVKRDVSSYHLKRESKSYRVFKPGQKVNNSSGFIKIQTLKEKVEKPIPKQKISKNKRFASNSSDCSFFIDIGSDVKMKEETENSAEPSQNTSNKSSTSRYFASLDSSSENNSSVKRKEFSYIPTKIKRIKGNPKRKNI